MTESNINPGARKPLGIKSYGHVPHLPGSRIGPGDHKCHVGQDRICTVKTRDRHDQIMVQEKLDGSNVGVARLGEEIIALSRAGYRATTSPYEQHHLFAHWVRQNDARFRAVLREGERVCGEWLALAHGTRYDLQHEPFVAFDLMTGSTRTPYDEFLTRIAPGEFITPHVLHRGEAVSIDDALKALGSFGFHGALDPVEGAVWRVERHELIHPNSGERHLLVDFLAKFVRPDKIDGSYLPEVSTKPEVWNWRPS